MLRHKLQAGRGGSSALAQTVSGLLWWSSSSPSSATRFPTGHRIKLLAESEKHVELREHNKRLHKALEEVSKELVRYGDGPPRPEPNADHLCPISRELMREPVTASDGHVYERASIERWIKEKTKGNKKVPVRSPKTGEPLESIKLIPAHMVRSQIIEWLEKYGIKDEPED